MIGEREALGMESGDGAMQREGRMEDGKRKAEREARGRRKSEIGKKACD